MLVVFVIPRGTISVDIVEIAFFTIAICLAATVSCAAALANSVRICFFLFLTLLGIGVAIRIKIPVPELIFSFIPLAIGVPVVTTLEVIKRFYGSFKQVASLDEHSEGLQFGIKHLIIATTIVAASFGVGELVWPYLKQNHVLWMAITFTVCPGASALLGVWTVLGRMSVYRAVVSLIFCASLITGCSVVLGAFDSYDASYIAVWIFVLSIASVGIWLFLFLVRLDGYRFVKNSVWR